MGQVLFRFEKRLETGKELKGQSLPLHADVSNVLSLLNVLP